MTPSPPFLFEELINPPKADLCAVFRMMRVKTAQKEGMG